MARRSRSITANPFGCNRMATRRITVFLLLAFASAAAAGEPKPSLRVLFYGNSFTHGYGSTRSVDELFADIVRAAGHGDPFVRSAAVSSRDFNWHADHNTAAIESLADGQAAWDFVVMQEHSTKLTRAYPDKPPYPGSVEVSKRTVVRLHEAVRRHSPSSTPVLYETWARGPGHEWYEGADALFTGPAAMQAEVRAGYATLKRALDEAAGKEIALIAPVGDAWQRADYQALHASDNWHAQNRGTLLAALVIYGTIYQDADTRSIDLSGVLSSIDLTSEDGEFLAATADETLKHATEDDPVAVPQGGRP